MAHAGTEPAGHEPRRVTPGTDGRGDRPPRPIANALVVVLPAVLIGALYLWPFVTRQATLPFGYDTPKYVWRANLVADQGLDALPGSAPEGFGVNADRPGHPVVAALLRSALGADPLLLAFVLPAVLAVCVGLAAGAFALRGLGEPRWAFPIYAVAVGASVNVARTAVGYADNLLFDVVAVAAALLVVVVAQGKGGMAGGVSLLAGGALVHWNFALLFALTVLVLAALLLPASFRQWRGGGSLAATPSIRLGMLVGGSVVAGTGTLALGPSLPDDVPRVPLETILNKYGTFIEPYRFAILGPLAVAGVPALWWPRDQARRRALLLLVLWSAVGVAGIVALRVLHLAVPAYRFVGFALGIPILGAAAIAGLGRLVARRGGLAGVALGVALSSVVVAGLSLLAHREWSSHDASMSPEQLGQVTTAGRYLEAVGGGGPVVFVVSRPGVALADHVIRSALQGDQITRALLYLGDTENLLAGRPTVKPDAGSKFNRASRKTWPAVQAVLAQRPPILFLSSFNPSTAPPPGPSVAPGVRVARGPPLSASIEVSAPIEAPSAPALIGAALAVLLVLVAVGLGWTASLVPAGWLERVAVAPAFGIAALAVAGVLADRLGLGLVGAPGVAVSALAAALGWSPLAVRWFAARRADHEVAAS